MRIYTSFEEETVKLGDLEAGMLFMTEDHTTIALKTEYIEAGEPACYIIGSGETFCATDLAKKHNGFNNIPVIPIIIQ